MCNYRESNGSPSSSSWRRRLAVVVMDLESVVLYLTGGTNREGNTSQCHGYQLMSMVVIVGGASRSFGQCGYWRLRASMLVTITSLRRSSEASYTGDDMGIPGIQGNDENLTFSWSSSMVENGN
ncbi:hypothetical protein YC2023_017027 [Brassica napus]